MHSSFRRPIPLPAPPPLSPPPLPAAATTAPAAAPANHVKRADATATKASGACVAFVLILFVYIVTTESIVERSTYERRYPVRHFMSGVTICNGRFPEMNSVKFSKIDDVRDYAGELRSKGEIHHVPIYSDDAGRNHTVASYSHAVNITDEHYVMYEVETVHAYVPSGRVAGEIVRHWGVHNPDADMVLLTDDVGIRMSEVVPSESAYVRYFSDNRLTLYACNDFNTFVRIDLLNRSSVLVVAAQFEGNWSERFVVGRNGSVSYAEFLNESKYY